MRRPFLFVFLVALLLVVAAGFFHATGFAAIHDSMFSCDSPGSRSWSGCNAAFRIANGLWIGVPVLVLVLWHGFRNDWQAWSRFVSRTLGRDEKPKFAGFHKFYPYYIRTLRTDNALRIHFFATGIVVGLLLVALLTGTGWLAMTVAVGYAITCWMRVSMQKGSMASRYPLYTLLGDWVLFLETLTGRLKH